MDVNTAEVEMTKRCITKEEEKGNVELRVEKSANNEAQGKALGIDVLTGSGYADRHRTVE